MIHNQNKLNREVLEQLKPDKANEVDQTIRRPLSVFLF